MRKSDVIWKIAKRLEGESLIVENIDETIVLSLEDAMEVIRKELDEYTLVHGGVVEN